jgi:hypothetical protein
VEKPVPTPETLLISPCDPVGPGSTVRTLARGYVKNTSCVGEHKEVLDGIRAYNRKILDDSDGVVDGKSSPGK